MQKLTKKILSVVVALILVLSVSFSCLAVNVEGDANGGGGGSTQAGGQYGTTSDEISGYRFTLVDSNNDMANNTHAIDVLITGTSTFSNAASKYTYRFKLKRPKTYWIKNINDINERFGINSNYLVQSGTNIVYDYGSAQEITYLGIKLSQDPNTILTQIKSESVINTILPKLGSTYTYNTLPAGYKVFCEPLFVFKGMAGSNGNYAQCCFTITEIGKYGCYMFGNNSGTESSYNANDFASIVNYTNGWWPHRLQVSKTVCGWTAASALSEYNTDNGIRPVKHTFYELVSYGYGVAFAYGDPSSVTTISVNPHVSINLQKKANDNSFVNVGAGELLEEGTTYRARYGLKSDNGAAVVYITDTNSLTGVSTYNNTTITVPSSGNWWYSNEFTIDSSCAGADINYEYLSANFDIGVSITFNAAATATLNNVTTATETTTADNSASATFKYVTLKPEVRNVVENKKRTQTGPFLVLADSQLGFNSRFNYSHC